MKYLSHPGRLVLFIAASTASFLTSLPVFAAGELEEIVVTARYREENIQQTPLAISAITAEDLKVRAFTNTYEIGYTVPNASFRPAQQAFGNTMTAYIRGIGQYDFDFAFEPGVGIYIDDVYHPFLLGSQMDLLDLDRVEVLRGPQGTLFGRGSIGGAMRLVSKKPQGDNTGYIEVTGGDYSRRDVRAGYDFAIMDNLFARVSGVSKHQDGYQDRIDFACANPALAGTIKSQTLNRGKDCKLGTLGGTDVTGIRGMLRWNATDDVEANLAIDYMKDDSEARADTLANVSHLDPATGQIAPGVGGAFQTYSDNYLVPNYGVPYDTRFLPPNPYVTYSTFGDQRSGLNFKPQTAIESWSVSGDVTWNVNEQLTAKVILAWTHAESLFATDADGSPFNIQTVDGDEKLDTKTAEIRLSGRVWDRMDYTVGGFFYHGKATNYQTVSLPPFSYAGQFFGPFLNCLGAGDPAALTDPLNPCFGGPFSPAASAAIAQGIANPFIESGNGRYLVNARNAHVADAEAGFGQVVYDLIDNVRITAGLRFSHDRKEVDFDNNFFNALRDQGAPILIDDTHFDWRVGADYQYTDDIMFYASAATGYRPGSYNPRPFSPAQAAPVSGEEQTAYEGGIKADLLDRTLRMNIAGFYSDYSKRIVPRGGTECVVPDPTPSVTPNVVSDTNGNYCLSPTSLTGYINVPGEIYGVEVETTWKPLEQATITGTFGWTQWSSPDQDNCDFNNDGVPDLVAGTFFGVVVPAQCNSNPAFVPEMNWSIGASYDFGVANGSTVTPRVDVYGQSEICSGAVNNGNNCAPSYELVNAAVAWSSPGRSWTATAGVTNLTDKAYILNIFDLSAFGQATTEAQYGQPRAWYFTVRRDFD